MSANSRFGVRNILGSSQYAYLKACMVASGIKVSDWSASKKSIKSLMIDANGTH
jgi:hypothetical protein